MRGSRRAREQSPPSTRFTPLLDHKKFHCAVCPESKECRIRDHWIFGVLDFDAFSVANKRTGKALCLTCLKKSPRFFPMEQGAKKLKIF
jgi:hypothetical protein